MSRIILDMSANTHKNDHQTIEKMMYEIKKIDTGKHEIIFKAQLFLEAGLNIPLTHEAFDFMYLYGTYLGYAVTSSVFDLPSLKFLLTYNPCFVKTANNRSLDYLIGEVPRKIPVYQSLGWGEESEYLDIYTRKLLCVSKYPAEFEDYDSKMFFVSNVFNNYSMARSYDGISDHTIGLELFKRYKPEIWEKHYKLSDSTGLDAGPFAITPEELKEIL